jgi:hypothetical protein
MLTVVKRLFGTRGRAEPTEEALRTESSSAPPQDTGLAVPREQRSQDQILLFLVDLLDEVDRLPPSTTEGKEELAIVRSRILDRLLLSDAEMIRDETWDPERQRAVEVTEGAMDGGTPQISSSRVSGLSVSGRIVRKQEVSLDRR